MYQQALIIAGEERMAHSWLWQALQSHVVPACCSPATAPVVSFFRDAKHSGTP